MGTRTIDRERSGFAYRAKVGALAVGLASSCIGSGQVFAEESRDRAGIEILASQCDGVVGERAPKENCNFPIGPREGFGRRVVEEGDNMTSLAEEYGVSPEYLIEINEDNVPFPNWIHSPDALVEGAVYFPLRGVLGNEKYFISGSVENVSRELEEMRSALVEAEDKAILAEQKFEFIEKLAFEEGDNGLIEAEARSRPVAKSAGLAGEAVSGYDDSLSLGNDDSLGSSWYAGVLASGKSVEGSAGRTFGNWSAGLYAGMNFDAGVRVESTSRTESESYNAGSMIKDVSDIITNTEETEFGDLELGVTAGYTFNPKFWGKTIPISLSAGLGWTGEKVVSFEETERTIAYTSDEGVAVDDPVVMPDEDGDSFSKGNAMTWKAGVEVDFPFSEGSNHSVFLGYGARDVDGETSSKGVFGYKYTFGGLK